MGILNFNEEGYRLRQAVS